MMRHYLDIKGSKQEASLVPFRATEYFVWGHRPMVLHLGGILNWTVSFLHACFMFNSDVLCC